MAQTTQKRRVNSNRPSKQYYRMTTFEDGSAVRQIALPVEEEVPRRRPAVSRQTRRNRARARSLSVGYVFFLAAVCVATMFLCIHFIQLKSRLITQNDQIASMETELSRVRADNDAYYKHALASVTLDEVRETAMTKLGMHSAREEQIRYYRADDAGSYVRQYQEVP